MSEKVNIRLDLDHIPKNTKAAQITLADIETSQEYSASTKIYGQSMTLKNIPRGQGRTYIEITLLDSSDNMLDRIVIVSSLPQPLNVYSVKSLAGIWHTGRQWMMPEGEAFDVIRISALDMPECDATHIYTLGAQKTDTYMPYQTLFYKNSDTVNTFFFSQRKKVHLRLNCNYFDTDVSDCGLALDRTIIQPLLDKQILSKTVFSHRGSEIFLKSTLWHTKNERIIERAVVNPNDIETAYKQFSVKYAGYRATINDINAIPVIIRDACFLLGFKYCSRFYKSVPIDYKTAEIAIAKMDLALYPLVSKKIV